MILSLGCIYITAQAQNPANTCDTIPYEFISGKIVLSMKLNGKPVKFILDTGGVNLITSDMAENYGVRAISRELMADGNLKGINFFRGEMKQLQLSENLSIPTTNVMISPPMPFFRMLGVAGVLGGEAFADICLVIDGPRKQIILTHPYRPAGIPRNGGLPMQTGNKFHSKFTMTAGGVEFPVLFDTGFDGFFHITKADYSRISESEPVEVIASGTGIWHVGVSGFEGLEPQEMIRPEIPSLKVMGHEFTHVATLTQNASMSIIGEGLLEYGTVILDYPRNRFYFYPFADGPENMKGRDQVWNVNILPVIDHFEITGILGDTGVECGERVWNINGTPLDNFPLSQPDIIGLLKKIDTDMAYILVGESKDQTRKVIIKKI